MEPNQEINTQTEIHATGRHMIESCSTSHGEINHKTAQSIRDKTGVIDIIGTIRKTKMAMGWTCFYRVTNQTCCHSVLY